MREKYCSQCGEQMIEVDVPAETEKTYCFGIDCYKRAMGSPYDIETGKRQYAKKFTCPNFKDGWFFTNNYNHDNYYIDIIFTKRLTHKQQK